MSRVVPDVMSEMLRSKLVPEGWTVTPHADHYVVLSSGEMMVTIDLERRVWRAGGFVTSGTTFEKRDYRGRGWHANLLTDAINYLTESMKG